MPKFISTNRINLLLNLNSPFKNHKFPISISQFQSQARTFKLGSISNELENVQSQVPTEEKPQLRSKTNEIQDDRGVSVSSSSGVKSEVQVAQPWPEWEELMKVLVKRGYIDEIGNPFGSREVGSKNLNLIRTACLNFSRDRCDLIRFLSRRDIKVAVGSGCLSLDRKVVNSGKRLRALVGINEGNVCSSCSFRGNCDRAYTKAREDEVGRTVDIMRILLTYGLNPITRCVENGSCQTKPVQESVRRLLKEMVAFSEKELDSVTSMGRNLAGKDSSSVPVKDRISVPMKQGDWICPSCNFLNFAKNIKCLRCDGLFQDRLRKMNEDQDQLPLKKGDWICVKCNFLNFAKNSRCLQCQEKPPKRQLGPGEWECDSCHYINFRKNMVCLRCDFKRPKTSNPPNPSSELKHENLDRSNDVELKPTSEAFVRKEGSVPKRSSNLWDFVEDESRNEDESTVRNDILELMDFPIAGGRSAISQDEQKIEEWKSKVSEKRESTGSYQEKTHESRSAVNGGSNVLERVDDDEMAEWFRGCR